MLASPHRYGFITLRFDAVILELVAGLLDDLLEGLRHVGRALHAGGLRGGDGGVEPGQRLDPEARPRAAPGRPQSPPMIVPLNTTEGGVPSS